MKQSKLSKILDKSTHGLSGVIGMHSLYNLYQGFSTGIKDYYFFAGIEAISGLVLESYAYFERKKSKKLEAKNEFIEDSQENNRTEEQILKDLQRMNKKG